MEMNRRSFLKASALAGGTAALVGLTGCSSDSGTAETTSDLPQSWDFETDILVVGAGGAGYSAVITSLQENLGEVLMIEAAPEEGTGGNTRVCGQLLFIPESAEDAVTYQTHLNGFYPVEDEYMQAWGKNLVENYDWLTDLGADLVESPVCNPEFPEVEGSSGCKTYFHEGVMGKSHLWEYLVECAEDLDYTVEYDTRAVELVFDTVTKEVYGVKAMQGDKEVYIKARKGVVLACGGFAANSDMIRSYYSNGYPDLFTGGTPYNRGDGIQMAQSVGADLWHMNNFSSSYLGAPVAKNCESMTYPTWTTKDYIYIAPNGKRYVYEEMGSLSKHGKMERDGVYTPEHVPMPQHVVFGKTAFEAGDIFPEMIYFWPGLVDEFLASDNQGYVDAGIFIKADTARELAEKISVDPETLEQTINDYNSYCEKQKDLEFGRGEDVYGNFSSMTADQSQNDDEGESVVIEGFPLVPLEPPFYAMRQYIVILNTQGGPRRGTLGEVLNTKTEPIPRLYAAGEMGTVYSYEYNGGGNVSEAISSGRLAARSCGALEPWEVAE